MNIEEKRTYYYHYDGQGRIVLLNDGFGPFIVIETPQSEAQPERGRAQETFLENQDARKAEDLIRKTLAALDIETANIAIEPRLPG